MPKLKHGSGHQRKRHGEKKGTKNKHQRTSLTLQGLIPSVGIDLRLLSAREKQRRAW